MKIIIVKDGDKYTKEITKDEEKFWRNIILLCEEQAEIVKVNSEGDVDFSLN